jgi:ABC-2 type transport system ATP-binding protein
MIRTQNLTKTFRRLRAIDNLSLEVPESAVFALVGPNGAGKSTLIKTLLNIWEPSAGTAEILGVDSHRLGPVQLRRIGYVSEGQQMPEWMTVASFLSFCRGFYQSWDDSLTADLLRMFDLPVDRKLRHLSRGMRMKAALTSSLAYRPKLIILDEPFSGLDVLVRDELIDAILERASDSTVLLASHDLGEIENFATHIAYIDQGRLWFTDEMAVVRDRFREVEVTLEGLAALPLEWPGEWLSPEHSQAVLRFTDTAWSLDTESRIRALLPNVRSIQVRSLPLRSIFVALAKSQRKTRGAAA